MIMLGAQLITRGGQAQTAATAYYLFQLMDAYPVLVQYTEEMLHTLHSSKREEVKGYR